MTFARCLTNVCLGILLFCSLSNAQQSVLSTSPSVVPRLVNFSGRAADAQGKPIAGIAGVTFAIYKDQYAGAPLWMETQNVHPDARGNYTVQLGASKSDGLPLELFSSGEARWLGMRVNGAEEQPRVLLLSVPYALKAADAQTLGGLPPSAFVLALPPATMTSAPGTASQGVTPLATGTTPVTTAGGTVNKLAKFDAKADLTNSQVFDNGTNVGIGNTAPGAKLDVSGTGIFRGSLSLPATAAATATAGKNSQPFNFTASAFNSGTAAAVNQVFRWQAEPTGNNTGTTSATLNLLSGTGAAVPTETGLKIAKNGAISFAPGQTFPATVGTVKSVGLSAPSSDFTVSGSPVTSNGTLALNWIAAPTSASSLNTIVKRDSAGGFGAGSITSFSSPNIAISGESNFADGVHGVTHTSAASGVTGVNTDPSGIGVSGSGDTGVFGSGTTNGVSGTSSSSGGQGVNAFNSAAGDGILAGSNFGFAGFFNGDVDVNGTLSKAAGSFKIDHPLDPANKYLYHSFVESPDMMNIYNGNVTTDAQGNAVVHLPEWFETLNRGFRYQLTVIGQFSQAIVASKIANHQFAIKTDKPNVEVSWQVTGIRQDAWANAHRIPVEVLKPGRERGFYLHPELFGAPEEKSVAWARHPQAMRQWREARMKFGGTSKKQARPKR